MKTAWISIFAVILAGVSVGADWPVVAQPDKEGLAENVASLTTALGKAGVAWSPAVKQALQAWEASRDAVALQAVLDSECAAAVAIDAGRKLRIVAPVRQPVLLESGWRTFLIKVVNEAAATTTLHLDSPNAGQRPNAAKDEQNQRWLGAEFVDRAPLRPNLSGKNPEYRLVHLWADAPGTRQATLTAALGNGQGGGVTSEWKFARDTGGWVPNAQCTVTVTEGALKVTPSGNDPWISTAVRQPAGEKLLRFHAWNAGSPHWEVYWTTAGRLQADGKHRVSLTVFQDVANGADYSVRFTAEEALTGLRIDPGTGGGGCRIDDIELLALDAPGPERASAEISCQIEAAHRMTFSVLDESGKPAMASFLIQDEQGRAYPWPAKRLAPDFFFQQQIYRGDGESVHLPAGTYSLVCRRGPESVPERRRLTVTGPGRIAYQVKRWVDPSLTGWYSGDHHIHAAGCQHYVRPTEGVFPEDMQRHIMGEDLKVGCNLTWGPCFDFQKQFFTGRVDKVSVPPYLLRYDVEVSGFGSHQSGHLCLLRLKEQIIPGGESKNHWPTLGLSTLKWAKAQDAIAGPAHSGNGLVGEVARLPYPDGAHGLPNYAIPPMDGIGAMEYVADITQEVPGPDGKPVPAVDFISTMDTDRRAELNMWYHTLNCGFRLRASGETDFPCITGERVGGGRVYVKQKGTLNFDDWCEGIREGRSYVSDGLAHLMDFSVNGVELAGGKPDLALPKVGGKATANVRVAALPEGAGTVEVELVVNGFTVARQEVSADGREHALTFQTDVQNSGWMAVRLFPHAHTNPIFVSVGGKPVRFRRSIEWMQRCLEQCWAAKEQTYAAAEKADARELYDSARRAYKKLLTEAEVD